MTYLSVILLVSCLQQFTNLSEMQVQVIDISAYHCVEGDPTSLVVNPIIVELGLVNRTDNVADVLIVVFQQHHELVPVLLPMSS